MWVVVFVAGPKVVALKFVEPKAVVELKLVVAPTFAVVAGLKAVELKFVAALTFVVVAPKVGVVPKVVA